LLEELALLCLSDLKPKATETRKNMSCQACVLHGSIGINQSCDVKPSDHYKALYAMNTFPDVQIVNNAVSTKKLNIPVIGIMGTAFRDFIMNWFPKLASPFVLVINGCDLDFPTQYFDKEESFVNFIAHSKVKHVFAQNCVIRHPKVSKLPIGLDYHTLANSANSWGPCQSPMEQERALLSLSRKAKPFWERLPLCYSNFHFFFGPSHGHDRRDAMSQIPKDLVFYEPTRQPRLSSWTRQTEYAFVLSPHGNGLDCHRTWEALNLGCIPIVKSSPIDELYAELPVLIVDSWSNLSKELLMVTIDKFKTHSFDMNKLTLDYWKRLIRTHCSEK
jgi:hypothetical protein